jgi:hypothetical protein
MTTDLQIEAFFKGHPYWGGCLCKDQLVSRNPDGKVWIVNMDDSTGPGTHWVAAVDLAPLPPVYLDPFGIAPPPEILSFLKRSKRGLHPIYSKLQYQAVKSDHCAAYCVEFIDELLKHLHDPNWRTTFDDDLTLRPSAQNERLTGKLMKLLQKKR